MADSRKIVGWKLSDTLETAPVLETVREAVERDPQVEAVFLTSPSYDGFSSDLAGIAAYLHSRNIPLIVDAAHGAHLGFSEYLPKSALQEKAKGHCRKQKKTA